jgi:hypothetical protein
MQTSELTGAALDWAVAKCEGRINQHFVTQWEQGHRNYSTDWAQGGPIIEREYMYLEYSGIWRAYCTQNGNSFMSVGATPLIAAMRCYVASKLGDEVELPEELEVTA